MRQSRLWDYSFIEKPMEVLLSKLIQVIFLLSYHLKYLLTNKRIFRLNIRAHFT